MTNCVQRSIDEKWLPILRGEHCNQATQDCPCCLIHNTPIGCGDCPIAEYTNTEWCLGTPCNIYEMITKRWYTSLRLGSITGYPYEIHAELTACAQWEIDFLREVERGLRE